MGGIRFQSLVDLGRTVVDLPGVILGFGHGRVCWVMVMGIFFCILVVVGEGLYFFFLQVSVYMY